MAAGFRDSPRKRLVREEWNTPLLRRAHHMLGTGYFYWGLPGPDIIDIRLWRDMIRRVVAFEAENLQLADPRRDLTNLGLNLTRLNIPHVVYAGLMEATVLQEQDDDGQPYESDDDLVTLYNLDFCNSITGRIVTRAGPRCLRFEVLRRLLAQQKECCDRTGARRFIILLTVRQEFHAREMRAFVDDSETPAATVEFLSKLPPPSQVQMDMQRCPAHLKAFIFTTLRTYCRGLNIATFFLPPVSYIGSTVHSPMMHFVILCRFAPPDHHTPHEEQSAADFLRRACMRATDDGLCVSPCGPWETDVSCFEPAEVAEKFFS